MSWFFHKKPQETQEEQESQAEVQERQTMMEGINELDVMSVKEVMVPRIDVQFMPVDISRPECIRMIKDTGFSRYPVYEKSIDNIIGVLYAKDIIRAEGEPFSVRDLMRKAYFVPESKRLDDLLHEFKRRKVHIAIAVDEYGGVSGIICMEDILEVIVGDIQDEFDGDAPEEIHNLSDGSWIVDAHTSIDEVNDTLGLEIKDEENESIGGYVFEHFGRIPQKGESITEDGLRFEVMGILCPSIPITSNRRRAPVRGDGDRGAQDPEHPDLQGEIRRFVDRRSSNLYIVGWCLRTRQIWEKKRKRGALCS